MRDPAEVLADTFNAFTSKLAVNPGVTIPKLQFVQTGDVAFDQEALIVHNFKPGVYQGQPGQRQVGYQTATGGVALYAFDVGVTLIRNFPSLDRAGRAAPVLDPLKFSQASLQAGSDARYLTDTYFASVADHSINDPCNTIFFQGVIWIGPQGGLLATQLSFGIQL